MANYKNPMNIIEALVQLRDDLKLWVANNLRVKMNKNLGIEESGKILAVDENGDIVPSNLPIANTTTLGGVKIGTGIAIDSNGVISTVPMEVIDNLTSTEANKALSANQGKVLAEADVGKKANVTGAEIFNDYTNNRATGSYSHAEGNQSISEGFSAHAEGANTAALGNASHTEGVLTLAVGNASHAGGSDCIARGDFHFVHGLGLESNNESPYPQTIFGQYNVKDEKEDIVFMIGCGDSTTRKNVFEINSSGDVWGERIFGTVWNDYAEYRAQAEDIEPGYCVASSRNGQVRKTTELYQACDGIVSDTFGFSIGKTDTHQLPLAVAGRVLAYCAGNREDYKIGDTVCAGPEGKVYKMTRDEVKEWPDRIVGIVSEIPEYEIWGSGNTIVNNRIWIKVV